MESTSHSQAHNRPLIDLCHGLNRTSRIPFACRLGNKLIHSGATLYWIWGLGLCDGSEAHPERAKPQNAGEVDKKENPTFKFIRSHQENKCWWWIEFLMSLKRRQLPTASRSAFPMEVRGHQHLPQVIRLTSHCLGWDRTAFFLSGLIIAVSRPL